MPATERIEGEFHASLLQDLAAVVLVTVLSSLLAIHFEWTERFFRWSRRWESLELDEIAFVLLVLSCGLVWFSIRRWREARGELLRHLGAVPPSAASHAADREAAPGEASPSGPPHEEALERIQRLAGIIRASASEIAGSGTVAGRPRDLELHHTRSIIASTEQIDAYLESLRRSLAGQTGTPARCQAGQGRE